MLLSASTEAVCYLEDSIFNRWCTGVSQPREGPQTSNESCRHGFLGNVRVGWRRRTIQTPHTRIPRLWTALATQPELLGTRHALKHHRPLSFINLQAAGFSPTEDWNPYVCPNRPTRRRSLRPERAMLCQLSSCGCHYSCYQWGRSVWAS